MRSEVRDGAEVPADEALLIARGIASAVEPDGGLAAVQVSLLGAVHAASMGATVDFAALEPLGPDELAEALAVRPLAFRHRVVHHMVLGELILRPIPPEVARRVAAYAAALGIDDQFVRVARRYAQGGFGLAWLDLHRSGFAEHWERARTDQLKTNVKLEHQLAAGVEDAPLAERWMGFASLEPGTLGRAVWDMYRSRGFGLPGSIGGASAYLAQHDFVHVLADYGTNLNGELEVFALIGRADPDPKGFAWLATLIGLFETGYVADAGFFSGDLRERRLESVEMHVRIADALRRGQRVSERLGIDLFEIDYHEFADRPISEVCAELGIDPKGHEAVAAGSPGAGLEARPLVRRNASSGRSGAGPEPSLSALDTPVLRGERPVDPLATVGVVPLVQPGLFHRLGLAVEDAAAAHEWYERVMGSVRVAGTIRPHQERPVADTLSQEGADARLLWHGGLPLILLGASRPEGPVGRHIARWGTGLHSVAWEIPDMWTVDHLLRQREIRVTGVNLPGRHFFMHPGETHGVLIEWTDTSIVGDPRRGDPAPPETPGVVGGVQGVAWVTAVVADADATAALLVDLAGGQPVTGNPAAADRIERTVDVQVGDVVMRLITPRSDASRHKAALDVGPRLWSYAVRVPDLDVAISGLEGAGVKVLDRVGSVAWTDPATTLGIPIEWTDLAVTQA